MQKSTSKQGEQTPDTPTAVLALQAVIGNVLAGRHFLFFSRSGQISIPAL
jgi:hypothetical protein